MYEKLIALIDYLNARTAEYDEGHPTISDKEWDDKYFELVCLEKELGYTNPNSPTKNIVYNTVNELEKVEHGHKMLSLEKTKDIEEVRKFINGNEFIAMCKMDGLTCSLTYENGKLIRAETRGNGIVGENILHNVKVIPSIPNWIPIKDKIVIDGEIICTYENFEKFSNEYKNPRNFSAGSIRLLSAKECFSRNLTFVAWDVIEGLEDKNKLSSKLDVINDYGFIVVPHIYGSAFSNSIIDELQAVALKLSYPIDGIVFKFNDIKYGKSLGETAHHFKNAIAYKFYDETYPTELLDIEWGMGRTGTLTPVAVFKPVDIDGSVVERASLHNITVMYETLGDIPHRFQKVEVFKSNMIIPQIAEADKEKHGVLYYEQHTPFEIPNVCPVCGGAVEERTQVDSTILVCINPECSGKFINKLDHFCGKKGLDIKGLSKATLEKLIDWGWIKNISDIFELNQFKNEWVKKPGFGIKSVEKVLFAIEEARNCELHQFIAALGIPLIGTTTAKELTRYFHSWNEYIEAVKTDYRFYLLPNFGSEMSYAIKNFNYEEAELIIDKYIKIKEFKEDNKSDNLNGKVFVITGKLTSFKNRDELKDKIESLGGKVSGSISKNTSYLINNDTESSSSKNVSAKKLGIPIISEEKFIEDFLTF